MEKVKSNHTILLIIFLLSVPLFAFWIIFVDGLIDGYFILFCVLFYIFMLYMAHGTVFRYEITEEQLQISTFYLWKVEKKTIDMNKIKYVKHWRGFRDGDALHIYYWENHKLSKVALSLSFFSESDFNKNVLNIFHKNKIEIIDF